MGTRALSEGVVHSIDTTMCYERYGYTECMTLDTLIMLAGAFVATLPFLGFPNSWDSALFFVAGIIVVALGIVVRRRGKRLSFDRAAVSPHFEEHMPHPQREHVES